MSDTRVLAEHIMLLASNGWEDDQVIVSAFAFYRSDKGLAWVNSEDIPNHTGSKDETLERVREFVERARPDMVFAVFEGVLGGSEKAILVTASSTDSNFVLIRPILEGGLLGEVERYDHPGGNLTDLSQNVLWN